MKHSVLALCLTCVTCLLGSASCRVRRTEPAYREPTNQSAETATAHPVPSSSVTAPVAAPSKAVTVAFVALGGVGSEQENVESSVAALSLSRAALETGASCLDAAVAGVLALEDDASLPAGTGAPLRLDGVAEMDAAVMSSDGRFGAVAGISDVRNPAQVARAVADTPHRVLGGDGAVRFARKLGLEKYDARTAATKEHYDSLVAALSNADAGVPPDAVPWPKEGSGGAAPLWRSYLPRSGGQTVADPINKVAPPPAPASPPAVASPAASFAPPTAPGGPVGIALPAGSAAPPHPPVTSGADTVAVLARCPSGELAGAASGAGPWLSLPGRIGDVPVAGGALYVGPKAAVFVSGPGEQILTKLLARAIYDKLVSTGSPEQAASFGVSELSPEPVVVAILDEHGVHVAPAAGSAWAALDPELRTSGGAHR